MTKSGFHKFAAASLVLGLFCGTAAAVTVTPVSYSFDRSTACGTWCYHDPGRSKLTDGIFGTAGWAANSGQEWVGWVYQDVVNVDFDFGTRRRIDQIRVGTTQDNLADVVIPSISVYSSDDGTRWTFLQSLVVPPSSSNDVDAYSTLPHGFLSLDGLAADARYVRVAAMRNGPWTFMDEVQFTALSPTPAPEPFSLSLLGIGLAALGAALRKRS